nr:chromosome partitioning protein [Pseudomonas sp.]
LDVCLSVQQDRDLAARLHSSDLPLPAPELIAEDDSEDDIILIEEPLESAEESEEAALARAIAAEKELEA